MLELDPDNAAVQTKLADLYIKLGKKEDAKEIFFRAADSLHMRGALDAADEALNKILNIDPTNARALMKRAQLAMDQGDGATAARLLAQVSGLDANPDGLALLLRARLMTGEAESAEKTARSLAEAHKDFSGISVLAEWLLNNGGQPQGLALAQEFSTHLGSDTLIRVLEPVLTRERENISSLETLLSIYIDIGSKAHVIECTDLLADALVRGGNLDRARDLYAELAKLEPDNPVHEQRHRQMLTKLGQPVPADATPKPFVPEGEVSIPVAEEPKPEPFSAAVPAPVAEDVSSEWETAFEAPSASAGASAAQESVEETKFYIAQGMWSEAAAAVGRCESADPNHPELAGLKAQVAAAQQSASSEFSVEVQPPAAEIPVAPEAPPADFSFEVTPPVAEVSVEVPPPAAEPPVAAVATASAAPADQFGDFLSDLDSSLPQDFHAPAAPQAKAAAASAAPSTSPRPVPVAPPPATASTAPKSEEESLLDDMFQEFKEEAEQGAGEVEDPETHYNLGVAFREMGLMDEAIGELQKVCQAIEKGASFRDSIQAFTWLAQCFVDKGVPEASYKWYEKALKMAAEEDQRLALNYDLASAYELAGNKASALKYFMDVYSANIDYRDVAERIKALRA